MSYVDGTVRDFQGSAPSFSPNIAPNSNLLIGVGTPSNANAASAGVPLYGFYRGTADPAIVYQRTV